MILTKAASASTMDGKISMHTKMTSQAMSIKEEKGSNNIMILQLLTAGAGEKSSTN
jgi:hypothetical protein